MNRLSCSVVLLSLVAAWSIPCHAGEAPANLLNKVKQVLAQLDGEIRVPGLKEPVEIVRDRWGVPHIYAKSADDLFFAQGFVAAQDRLFQLEMWRRLAAGEMAELLGPDALDADRFARLLRYRGNMETEWASYSPDARRIATTFTRGINACIDHTGKKLPIEFQILGFAPKKWQPDDVLGRMSGIVMSQNFRNEAARARLLRHLERFEGKKNAVEILRILAPTDPPRDYSWAPGLDLTGFDERILGDYRAATKLLGFKPAKTESNNWVVSGNRSVSGMPLLASDPHRAITLPSLRYLVHLNAPGWNVIGGGEPALPGIALGHNDRIAWGFTIVGTDQADIFVEEINPENPLEYKVGQRWQKMEVLQESVRVKGKAQAARIELRFTRHGPVLFQDDEKRLAYALKWAGSEPGGAAYLGSLAVARSQNKKEFLEALKAWKVPGLNFVYAVKDGTIGWIGAALTPIRPRHDGLLPVPGNGGFEWAGYLPVADLPQTFNPKSGWLATANHNILPPGYAHQIAYEWAPPYRFQRVKQMLESKEKWGLDDFKKLQHDVMSIPGLALAKRLKTVSLENKDNPELYKPVMKELEACKRLVTEWDGVVSADSKPALIYAFWLDEMLDELNRTVVRLKYVPLARSLGGIPVLLGALDRGLPIDGPNGKGRKQDWDVFLQHTFAVAVAKMHRRLPNPADMRWGKVHTATFRHPLAALDPAYAKTFNLGPVERPGDANTVNNTRHDETWQQVHGATYRHLFDLADWDRGLATSAPGQSGQPGSPHYGDLLPLWAEGRYFPLAFSRDKVNEVTRHRLWLKPQAE
jgi:penicillin amidase